MWHRRGGVVSNQSHLALVAEIRGKPDEAEEERLATQAASAGQDHDRPQPPTHPEAVMSIRELLDEAETRHAEVEVQYWRTRELLDELVRVAYEEYMDGGRAYPREDPPGCESTNVSRWLDDHRSLLPPGVPFPRRSTEFNRVSGSSAHREWRAKVLGALALSAALCAIVEFSRRVAAA
jgi:hypothetical protein